jgi:biotin operon repressor
MNFIIIPFDLLARTDLTASEKNLMGLIQSLSAKEGHCFASNQYLATSLGSNSESVRKWINALEKKGLLSRVIKKKPNGEVDTREIRLTTPMVKNDHTYGKILPEGMVKIDHIIDNTNKESNKSIERFEEFWNIYNKKVGKDKTKAKWSKLKEKEIDAIFKALPSYIASREVKYRKDPERYLTHRVWEDEMPSEAQASNPLSAIKLTEIEIPDNF